jgi:hypothetical protein
VAEELGLPGEPNSIKSAGDMKKRSAYAGAVPAPLVAVDYNPLRLGGASMHVQLAGTLAEIARVYALVFDYSMGQDAHLLAALHVTGDVALIVCAGRVRIHARRVHAETHDHLALAAEPALEIFVGASLVRPLLVQPFHQAVHLLFFSTPLKLIADREAAPGDDRDEEEKDLLATILEGHDAPGREEA